MFFAMVIKLTFELTPLRAVSVIKFHVTAHKDERNIENCLQSLLMNVSCTEFQKVKINSNFDSNIIAAINWVIFLSHAEISFKHRHCKFQITYLFQDYE